MRGLLTIAVFFFPFDDHPVNVFVSCDILKVVSLLVKTLF